MSTKYVTELELSHTRLPRGRYTPIICTTYTRIIIHGRRVCTHVCVCYKTVTGSCATWELAHSTRYNSIIAGLQKKTANLVTVCKVAQLGLTAYISICY